MARRQLAGQQAHTLDATALVHEAYLKLIGRQTAQFDDRAHFFAYAASAMRSVVVDYARQRLAQKRGGDLHRVTELPEEVEGGLRLDEETLGLDTALTRLAAVDERLAQVVELRYFAGLSELEIAEPAQALRTQHPPRLAEGAAVPAGLAEGRLTSRFDRWTPNAGNGCPRCSTRCSSCDARRARAASTAARGGRRAWRPTSSR